MNVNEVLYNFDKQEEAYSLIWLSCLKVRKEIEQCYELIHRQGRGVVYLGSSRMGPDHPHYLQALELGREARHQFHIFLFKSTVLSNICMYYLIVCGFCYWAF